MKRSDKDKNRALGHPDSLGDSNDVTSPDKTIQYDPDKTQMNVGENNFTSSDEKTQMNRSGQAPSPGRKANVKQRPPQRPAAPPLGATPPQRTDSTVIRNKPQNPDSTVIRNRPQQQAPQPAAGNLGAQPPQRTDSTVIRNKSQNPDSTVIRNNPQQPVERNKMNNPAPGMDATRMNPSQGQAARPDATQIAPRKPVPPTRQAGQQTRSQQQQHQQQQRQQPQSVPPAGPITASSISPSQSSQSNPNSPRVLKNRFLLEKVLGVGGMGIVYKAKDRLKIEAKDRDPYVAIKVLSEEFKQHPESFIALQRESRKSQRMAHPNTVKVFDFDRDGDDVFMTMEYLEGDPLDQLLRQYNTTGLPHDDAWKITEGICAALSHAHMENIVHSDFKPGNVFVTTTGMAKVFDFGIARAVAKIDRNDGKAIDKTVFDVGSLGALTPAYASMEMLQGKTPDVRDDIYALGCVIYELFTGVHPFAKMPADEAHKKGLKAKRIDGISKKQWKAVEKSLAFKRNDRIETVDELYKELTTKYKPSYVVGFAMLVIIALSSVIYIQSTSKGPQVDVNAIEFKVRLDVFKENIARLIRDPSFSLDWEDNLWGEVKEVSEFLPSTDNEWLIETKRKIYQLYVDKIQVVMTEQKYSRAKILINNAYRYTEDTGLLDGEKIKLAAALKRAEQARKQQLAKQIEVKKVNKSKYDEFNVALGNVDRQLRCQGSIDMRNFAIAIKKLQSIDNDRYAKMENKFVRSLSSCITEIGKALPERAKEAKKSALRIFRANPQISRIKIAARDACDISLAGLGASGSRSACRDKVRGIGQGPSMVVIPGSGNIKPFAISKFEISVDDMNLFCKDSKKCEVNRGVDKHLPSTNVSIRMVKKYIKWLSDKSGQNYRLPTDDEWLHAATTKRRSADSNRNCKLSSRGIEKGQELVKTTTGRQNSWGLVNHVGNAQEWVYGNGRKLIAVGGSYKDSMEVCNTSLRRSHSGKPDEHTGFRVIRVLRDK